MNASKRRPCFEKHHLTDDMHAVGWGDSPWHSYRRHAPRPVPAARDVSCEQGEEKNEQRKRLAQHSLKNIFFAPRQGSCSILFVRSVMQGCVSSRTRTLFARLFVCLLNIRAHSSAHAHAHRLFALPGAKTSEDMAGIFQTFSHKLKGKSIRGLSGDTPAGKPGKCG